MSKRHSHKTLFARFTRLLVATCCAAILIGSTQAMAQLVRVIPPGDGSSVVNEDFLLDLMELRITELQTACGLSESQVKKLKVMAKVAVANTIKSRKERAKKKQPWNGLNPQIPGGFKGIDDPDGETFSDEDDENSEAQEALENDARRKSKAPPVLDPHDTPVWKDAIKQILTDEQQEQWKKVTEAHRAFGRRRAAYAKVDQMNMPLRLEMSQRAKLLTAIEDAFAKLPASKWEEYQLKDEVLQNIFSEQQLAVYNNAEFENLNKPRNQGGAIAKQIQKQLFGSIGKPYFGASAKDSENGVQLHRIKEGAPAAKAGLQDGDIITSISGQYIDTALQFRRAISSAEIGTRISVAFIRNGEKLEVTMIIGQK